MRARYVALVAVLVLVALGYVAFWFWMAAALERGVHRWADERRLEGMEVDWRELSVGGFPFRLRATVEEPRLALPRHPLAPEWRGGRLVAYAHPWNLRHVLASFKEEHVLSFRQGEARRLVALRARSWLASWQGGPDGRTRRVSVDLHDAEAMDSAVAGPTRAARLQVHARPGQAPNALADLAFSAAEVSLPQAAALPLGPEIERVELDATLLGPFPEGGYPEGVLRWRDEGGVVEVRRFALDWNEVRIEAAGTLALDAATRPEGAFTAKLWNHGKLLDALVAANAMSPDDARLARAALDLLAAAGGGALTAPVTAQNGRLWLGPAAVARLSPLLPGAARNPAPASPAPQR
jgi:hypothetical protein